MKVVAIVVTYHPKFDVLSSQLVALSQQVAHIVIIDNNSPENLVDWNQNRNLSADAVISLPSNLGIGAAQNIGIDWARKQAADYVLLMDQDSIPEPDMVTKLVESYSHLLKTGHKVAAVGSQYRNDKMQANGFVRFTGGIGSRVIGDANSKNVVRCDFLIASGTLISMPAIDAIGKMDASLFIDHVDTEWCLRARSMGYGLFGVCSAFMTHELGVYTERIWFFRWRNVAVHAPFRYYYMVRNSLLLHRRSYPDLHWRLFDFQRLFQILVFFGFCIPGRTVRLKMILKGGYDGMRGITGKIR